MKTCERLREERKRLGLNQDGFAALGGVQRTAQINYEKGERNPDAAYLSAIAAAGVDVTYILTGVRTSAALEADETALLDNYRRCPEQGKDAIRRTVSALSLPVSISVAPKAEAPVAASGSHSNAVGGNQTVTSKEKTVTASGGSVAAGRDVKNVKIKGGTHAD